MIKLAICLVSLSLLFRCNNYPCAKNKISPAFIGYSSADIDTFILRAYKPNDSYQHLLDTIVVTNRFASVYTSLHDTTVVYVNDSNPDRWISAGFDWEVYIPAKNKVTRISNIVSPQTEGSYKKCINPINSFEQDGQHVVPRPVNDGRFYTSGYLVYIGP